MTKSTPTLTQSGLLAVLLQRQRYKVIPVGPASSTPPAGACGLSEYPQLAFGTRSRRHRWSTIPPRL